MTCVNARCRAKGALGLSLISTELRLWKLHVSFQLPSRHLHCRSPWMLMARTKVRCFQRLSNMAGATLAQQFESMAQAMAQSMAQSMTQSMGPIHA